MEIYAKAFEKGYTVSITDKGDKAGPLSLKLKYIFSCEPKNKLYCGEDIKLKYLALKSCRLDSDIIVGAICFEMTKLVIKNFKTATVLVRILLKRTS